MIFTEAIYKKLSISEIEDLHKINNINVTKSILKGQERKDELKKQYYEIWNIFAADIKTPVLYKNAILDSYLHANFNKIIKNLQTYNLIIKSAIEVSKNVSLHCSEDAFQKAMEYELNTHSYCIREKYVNIFYKKALIYQARIDIEFMDFVIELKKNDKLESKNDTQLQLYLDNTNYTKGILINFNTKFAGNRRTIDTRVLLK
jgi:GxxExxY protein